MNHKVSTRYAWRHAAIRAGELVHFFCRLDVTWRPEYLVQPFDGIDYGALVLEGVRVGVVRQGRGLPRLMSDFVKSDGSQEKLLDGVVCFAGMDVTIDVRNVGDRPLPFAVDIVGRVVG